MKFWRNTIFLIFLLCLPAYAQVNLLQDDPAYQGRLNEELNKKKLDIENVEDRIASVETDIDGKILIPASSVQGDILFHNGTVYTRLSAGTSGYYLKTQGAGANPTWAEVVTTNMSLGNASISESSAAVPLETWTDVKTDDVTLAFYRKGQTSLIVAWQGYIGAIVSPRFQRVMIDGSSAGASKTITTSYADYTDTVDISGLTDNAWHYFRIQGYQGSSGPINHYVRNVKFVYY